MKQKLGITLLIVAVVSAVTFLFFFQKDIFLPAPTASLPPTEKQVIVAGLATSSVELINAESQDSDGDGLSNDLENYWGTDSSKADSDGDSFSDLEEINHGYSPLNPKLITLRKNDYDQDGLNDAWEKLLGTNPLLADTDHDGFNDGDEVKAGHDPLSASPDLLPKKIEVSIKEQKLKYSFNGIVLDEFLISSAARGYKTPTGEFPILKKRPAVYYGGVGYSYPNTKWNLLFYQGKAGYYIHGAYWHNNFGHPMSHGCVNVSYANMEDLYNWADENTVVSIH